MFILQRRELGAGDRDDAAARPVLGAALSHWRARSESQVTNSKSEKKEKYNSNICNIARMLLNVVRHSQCDDSHAVDVEARRHAVAQLSQWR